MTSKHNGTRQAILWGRFSSDKQSEGDSRERQERLNRALAERMGVKVIKEYFDEGVSVKDGATPLFRKVITNLPEGVGIICENLDRINRGHPWRAKAYIADILDAGHFIITSQDGREYTAESIGELDTLVMGDISANVAYAENSKRIKRVNEAKDQAIALARKSIPAPLGAWLPAHIKYNFETGQYVINEDIKAILKRIFREYLSDKGAGVIAAGLNDDGIKSFRGKKWIRSAVAKLLRYEGVIGVLNINGERIPNAYPPAITEDLFYDVQAMLKKHTKRHGNYSAKNIHNVFRGICKCAKCGSGMYIHKARWIGCKGHQAHICDIKNLVKFPAMEQQFLAWFVPHAKDALLGKDDSQPRIDALTAKKDALDAKVKDTIALLDAGVAVNEVKSRLVKLEAEKNETENRLAEAKSEVASKNVMPETIKELETIIREANLGNQDTRRKIANVIPSLVKSVVIDISDKLYPSFHVVLSNDKAIEYTMTMLSAYGKDAYKQ